jgi:hypothetical protein
MAERGRDNVVDFGRYRAAREQARLPLFDEDRPEPSRLALVDRRELSAQQIAHRGRMLRHLEVARR